MPPTAPSQEGYWDGDGRWWCCCTRYCYGTLCPLSKATWYRHKAAEEEEDEEDEEDEEAEEDEDDVEVSAYGLPVAQQPHSLGADESCAPPEFPAMDLGGQENDETQTDPPAPLLGAPSAASGHSPQAIPAANVGEPAQEDSDSDSESGSSGSEDDVPTVRPTLRDLQITQSFIDALKDADLGKSGLDEETVRRLRDPEQYEQVLGDRDLRLSVDLFLTSTNASQQNYTDNRASIKRAYPDSEVLSLYQIKRRIQTLSGVVPIKHDMCPNTCLAYTGEFSSLDTCPTCGTTRYVMVKRKRKPRQHFFTIPIGPQIQALFRSRPNAQAMAYRRTKTKEVLARSKRPNASGGFDFDVQLFEDFVDGSDYLKAAVDGRITDDDVILVLSIDGAQLYEKKSSDCWMYIWIIFDLAPNLRYKKKHVIPGGFIPGPHKPKNLDSFLFPGLLHVAALQKEGLKVWDATSKAVQVKNLFAAFGTADGPGLVYLNGLVGHNGYLGCRLRCPTPGRRSNAKATRYYPVIARPAGDLPQGSDHGDVNIVKMSVSQFSNYQQCLNQLLSAHNPTAFKAARRATGISKQSLFSGLRQDKMFPVPTCFPSDMMHLICLNITDLLMELWRGTIDCVQGDSRSTWDWVVLVGDVWEEHGKFVESLRSYLLSSIERPPRNPEKKISSGYKAQEWLIYIFGYGVGLLRGILPMPYWLNFCKLVAGVRYLSARSISLANVLEAHRLLLEFVQEFEQLYVQRKSSRMHFVRQCIHNLIHLAPETLRIGPQSLYAQWTMERTIGNLGEEIKLPSNPYQNLSQRGVRRAQVNALYAMMPNLSTNTGAPRGSLAFGGGYTLLRPREEPQYSMTEDEREALGAYLHSIGYHGRVPQAIRRWGRLMLPDSAVVRTAWKETEKSIDNPNRTSRMITLQPPSTVPRSPPRIAEVLYFFCLNWNEENIALAMVSIGEDRDEELYQQSFGTLWTTEFDFDNPRTLEVVPIKMIKSSVSVLPLPSRAQVSRNSFFVMEEMGLDILAWYQRDGGEDDDEDGEDEDDMF